MLRWLESSKVDASDSRLRGNDGIKAVAGIALMFCLGLAHAKDTGRVFVYSEKDNALAVLEGGKLDVLGSPLVCKRPRHMQLSPDRTQLYVACSDDHRVVVWDIASGKVSARLGVGEDPEIFDLAPDGRTLYVSDEEDSTISAFDIATRRKLFE